MKHNNSPLKVKKYPLGKHSNSLKNLKPYPKGVSGNAGSGNGYSLTAELKHALNKEIREKLVQSTIAGAIKREPTPSKEVWDRVDGKVKGDEPPIVDIKIRGRVVRELGGSFLGKKNWGTQHLII